MVDLPGNDSVEDLEVGLREVFPEHVFDFDELAPYACVEAEAELVGV